MVEAPLAELSHCPVELGADVGHLALGHPGVDAEGGDEVVDPAGATPCTGASLSHRVSDRKPQIGHQIVARSGKER